MRAVAELWKVNPATLVRWKNEESIPRPWQHGQER